MNQIKPAWFVLFGATGDLAKRKLYPALYSLHSHGHLPANTRILGIGRREWSQENYHDVVLTATQKNQPVMASSIHSFLDLFEYHRMNITESEEYEGLWQKLDEHPHQGRLFFLATGPDLFPMISRRIGQAKSRWSQGYTRLMIEKPFGHDLDSARRFNEALQENFAEEDIFRIDHYLGKEMLQNISVLRFANPLFAAAWQKEHVDHVQITLNEAAGIENRGAYYDQAGALRDMVQNHVLQLIALVGMDPPRSFASSDVRDAKVRLLKTLQPLEDDTVQRQVVLGQYVAGSNGELAYRQENKVHADSQTETFAAIQLHLDHPRWRGVPFFIRTGKRMKKRQALITLVFKSQEDPFSGRKLPPNRLILRVQPMEGIDMRYNMKQPGTTQRTIPVSMGFCQTCFFPGQSAEAYVRLVLDAFQGDLQRFTRWDEIEASWRFIDSIRSRRHLLPLREYAAGEDGPAAAQDLLEAEGRKWQD